MKYHISVFGGSAAEEEARDKEERLLLKEALINYMLLTENFIFTESEINKIAETAEYVSAEKCFFLGISLGLLDIKCLCFMHKGITYVYKNRTLFEVVSEKAKILLTDKDFSYLYRFKYGYGSYFAFTLMDKDVYSQYIYRVQYHKVDVFTKAEDNRYITFSESL